MSNRGVRGAFVAILACLANFAVSGGERSYPLDCWPDRLVEWSPSAATPLYGAPWVPGILLGPPGDSLPIEGSFSVASMGFGGRAALAFDDLLIEDGPGPDFIVFENAFFKLPLPLADGDPFTLFAEPGRVEVSLDGQQWHAFPHDAAALAQVPNQADGTIDDVLYAQLGGLAGVTPTFSGNWTVPDDREVFDAAGQGGVSGAGGDAFDLALLGLDAVRFVRITDADTQAGFPGQSAGFDLDGVVVLHGRPLVPSSPDADGDRLSDAEELMLYGSSPTLADSDGDGVDDGREVAACRDPSSAGTAVVHHLEPRLWMLDAGGGCAEARWSYLGADVLYDVVRGELDALSATDGTIDLGVVGCLQDDVATVRFSCDGAPPSGSGFFYLVSVDGGTAYGRSSRLEPRVGFGGCP
jgi:hypothetical protein